MEYSTQELLRLLDGALKGITISSDLGATILSPDKFDRFVRTMQHRTAILGRVRMQTMTANKADIDRIAFGTRVMGVPPTEGTAQSTANFVSPTFANHQLEAQEMQGVVGITDKLLRRNIEKQGLMDTILDLIAERVGLDVEEQGINGDTDSGDAFLALNDGWIKKARRRVVEDALQAYDDGSTSSFTADGTTATLYYDKLPITGGTFQIYTTSTSGTLVADEDGDGVIDQVAASGIGGTIDYINGLISLTGLTDTTEYYVKYTADSFDFDASSGVLYPANMFNRMLRVIPKQYFRNPGEWEFVVPWDVLEALRDYYSNRQTQLGDEYNIGGGAQRLPYKGVWVQYAANMPDNRVWLTHPDNTVYGVFHEVTIEQEREAKAKRNDIIVDAETDYEYEEPEATVVAEIT